VCCVRVRPPVLDYLDDLGSDSGRECYIIVEISQGRENLASSNHKASLTASVRTS
jgi:hypothetical protein